VAALMAMAAAAVVVIGRGIFRQQGGFGVSF
jgi:hypothetical protein